MPFSTSTSKLRHLIDAHTCPISDCKFFTEFDADMQSHITSTHTDQDLIVCQFCKMKFPTQTNLETHLHGAHVKCIVCKEFFKDYAALGAHDPCTRIVANSPITKAPTGMFLEPEPKSDLDKYQMDGTAELTSVLSTICTALPGLNEEVKADLLASIEKYGASQRVSEHHERYPFKIHRMRRVLLEPPSFEHQGRESLSKVSDFLGKLTTWDPGHRPTDQMDNFLTLQKLHNAVKTATSACALSQKAAVAILLKTFSRSCLEALESYTFRPPTYCSYAEILKTAQNVFFANINLEDIAFAAENAKIQPHEKFHEFFLRAFTLLKTASLGRSESEKIAYIESNLRRCSLRALPSHLKQKIENIENLHGVQYSARDIADFVTSERISAQPTHGTMHTTDLTDLNHLFSVTKSNHQNDSPLSEADDENGEVKDRNYYGQEHNDEDEQEYKDDESHQEGIFQCEARFQQGWVCGETFEFEQDAIEHLKYTHHTSKRLYTWK